MNTLTIKKYELPTYLPYRHNKHLLYKNKCSFFTEIVYLLIFNEHTGDCTVYPFR